jgi:hypothetical protein
VDGDKVYIHWTGEQMDCIVDKSQTYNFDTKACTKMPQASFDCSWDSFFDEMEDRGITPTDKMKAARTAGAKLVTCGQSSDGDRIVVQWLNPPDGGFSCKPQDSAMPGLIVTGCYTKYKPGEPVPAAPKDKAEQTKQVYDCMNKL